ncbi:MAG: sigma-70 family RNA polymerase sigma factor [Planctomycetota bacterium]
MTEFPDTRSALLVGVQSHSNREAWQEFVLLYRPVIYRMARARGLQDADAQDLSQSVLLKIAAAIGRWEKRDSASRFRHWLRRIAKNAILTALTRSPKDLAEGGAGVWEQIDYQVQWGEKDVRELELETMRESYLRAAAIVRSDVSPDTWRAFELTAFEGVSCEQAALVIGKSVGTVYAARSRVIHRLKQQVTEAEEHES